MNSETPSSMSYEDQGWSHVKRAVAGNENVSVVETDRADYVLHGGGNEYGNVVPKDVLQYLHGIALARLSRSPDQENREVVYHPLFESRQRHSEQTEILRQWVDDDETSTFIADVCLPDWFGSRAVLASLAGFGCAALALVCLLCPVEVSLLVAMSVLFLAMVILPVPSLLARIVPLVRALWATRMGWVLTFGQMPSPFGGYRAALVARKIEDLLVPAIMDRILLRPMLWVETGIMRYDIAFFLRHPRLRQWVIWGHHLLPYSRLLFAPVYETQRESLPRRIVRRLRQFFGRETMHEYEDIVVEFDFERRLRIVYDAEVEFSIVDERAFLRDEGDSAPSPLSPAGAARAREEAKWVAQQLSPYAQTSLQKYGKVTVDVFAGHLTYCYQRSASLPHIVDTLRKHGSIMLWMLEQEYYIEFKQETDSLGIGGSFDTTDRQFECKSEAGELDTHLAILNRTADYLVRGYISSDCTNCGSFQTCEPSTFRYILDPGHLNFKIVERGEWIGNVYCVVAREGELPVLVIDALQIPLRVDKKDRKLLYTRHRKGTIDRAIDKATGIAEGVLFALVTYCQEYGFQELWYGEFLSNFPYLQKHFQDKKWPFDRRMKLEKKIGRLAHLEAIGVEEYEYIECLGEYPAAACIMRGAALNAHDSVETTADNAPPASQPSLLVQSVEC